jgi:hypothetical protein
MDQETFFRIVKEEMKPFFKENGYKKCGTHKGRRSSVSFEKDMGNFSFSIEIKWIGEINRSYMFAVYYISLDVSEYNDDPNANWHFSDEEELRAKLSIVKEKIVTEQFFARCEQMAQSLYDRAVSKELSDLSSPKGEVLK